MTKENSSVLGNAKNHFKSALAQELVKIEVPEWETVIHFKAATTFASEQKIIELHQKGNLVEALVETLVSKSLTAEGTKMFTQADRIVLMRQVDPDVIIKIVSAMNDAKQEAKDGLGN
jgi:hypothetical protein